MNPIACTRCNRPLRNPQYVSGMAYGSVCVRSVAPMQRAAAAVRSRGRRRRAAAVEQREVDPRQCELFAEVQL